MVERSENSPESRVRIEDDIVVGTGGGRPLRCDLFHPPAPPPPSGHPAVVLIHGGAWKFGDRKQLRGYGILLAREGYLCAAVEYRLTDEAKWPAQLHDVRTAVRFVRAHADRLRVDPNRIAVSGNSAGGHLALMIAANPEDPALDVPNAPREVSATCAACIAFYPPVDLVGDRGTHTAPFELFERGVTDAHARNASPINYARRDFPPTMLIHGNRDDVVAPGASLDMYAALTKAGAGAELHMYNDAIHAFDAERQFGRHCIEVMLLFLKRHL